MPNWIEGSLKIRGTNDNIVKFFKDNFDNVEIYEDGAGYMSAYAQGCDIWVKDSPRAFIQHIDAYWIKPEKADEEAIVVLPVQQAWGFDLSYWVERSEKGNIDIRAYGFECGMEFTEEFEIIKGVVTFHNVKKYDNYEWECPMPNLGG